MSRIFTWSWAIALAAGAGTPPAPLVVYVVRHAEKAGPEGDVPLSDAGSARAAALARMLADVPVQGVHATATVRTASTARPTAELHHLEVRPYDAADPTSLLEALRAERGAHLVVGHSNTVPGLVEAIGGGPQAPMADAEYDRLTVVVVPAEGAPVVQVLRYRGEPCPSR